MDAIPFQLEHGLEYNKFYSHIVTNLAVCETEKWSIIDNGSTKNYISMAQLRLV